jgi:hypothetical protein
MEALLIAIVAALGLFGTLQNKTKIEMVTEYRNTLIAPPDDLLVNCEVMIPPTEEVYLGLETWTAKEALLFKALSDSQKKSILCNTRLDSLRVWKEDQIKIYADPVKEK